MSEYEAELEKHNGYIEKELHDVEKQNAFYYWAIQQMVTEDLGNTFQVYSLGYTQKMVDQKLAKLKATYNEYKVEKDG